MHTRLCVVLVGLAVAAAIPTRPNQDDFRVTGAWSPPGNWSLDGDLQVSRDGKYIYALLNTPEFSPKQSALARIDAATMKSDGPLLTTDFVLFNFKIYNATTAFAHQEGKFEVHPVQLDIWEFLPAISLAGGPAELSSLQFTSDPASSLFFMAPVPNWATYLQYDLMSGQWVGNFSQTPATHYVMHPTEPRMYYEIDSDVGNTCKIYEATFPATKTPITIGSPSVDWPVSRTLKDGQCYYPASIGLSHDAHSLVVADGGHGHLFQKAIPRVGSVSLDSFSITTAEQPTVAELGSRELGAAAASASYVYFNARNVFGTKHAFARVPVPLDASQTQVMELPDSDVFADTPRLVAGPDFAVFCGRSNITKVV